jgi:amino acid transporter
VSRRAEKQNKKKVTNSTWIIHVQVSFILICYSLIFMSRSRYRKLEKGKRGTNLIVEKISNFPWKQKMPKVSPYQRSI